MPWASGKKFASRHNKKLKGEAALTAKRQAEALIDKGMPEGMAIATANKTGDRIQARAQGRYPKMK